MKKNGPGQRAKPSTPTLAVDALIGEEEQNAKQEEEQKKQGVGSSYASYDPHGSYGGPILKTPVHRE